MRVFPERKRRSKIRSKLGDIRCFSCHAMETRPLVILNLINTLRPHDTPCHPMESRINPFPS